MLEAKRTYIAIDLKSYYASVECRERGLDPITTNLVVADLSRTEKTISSASASFARSTCSSFAFSFVIVISSFFGHCPVRIPCHNAGRKAIHKSQRKNLADGGIESIDGKTPPCLPKSVGAAGRLI